jgi:methyl-accepting chemotaxis protein
MKLLTKFNLILIVVFGAAGFLIAQLAYSFLTGNARREVMAQAALMMQSATSVRNYTSGDLRPLLEKNPRHKVRFLAETVPAFAATTTFNNLRKSYPDYTYKEATLNPTNLEDRATDWEADVIHDLRDHPDKKQSEGDRQTSAGPAIYLAKPLSAAPACLECHSVPSAAPPAMLAVYGSANGFGWKPNEIIGAQIISVPLSVPIANANQAYHTLLAILISTLIATILALDAGVYWLVIRPLKIVSQTADRVSKGEKNVDPLKVKGKDEIASVTSSFNRMQLSLAKALKMLEE